MLGVAPLPVKETCAIGWLESLDDKLKIEAVAPFVVGSNVSVTVQVSACAGAKVLASAFAVLKSRTPLVEETTLLIEKAASPDNAIPFCEKMTG